MYSIGLDVSKATISIHVPLNSLDLEIENNLKSLKSFYAKLKKLYKKELDKLVFVYEPTGSAYFTLFFHPFHSQPSSFLSLKQACKIVA